VPVKARGEIKLTYTVEYKPQQVEKAEKQEQ
jgi:hypothetical protein